MLDTSNDVQYTYIYIHEKHLNAERERKKKSRHFIFSTEKITLFKFDTIS